MAARLFALLLATPLLLLPLGASHATLHQAQLPKVTVSQPLSREVTDHTEFRGRVEPREAIDVCARIGGEVVEIGFKPGDGVKKGDLLFQLDPRPSKVALEKAEAEMERARANVQRAAVELARAKRVAATGAGVKEEVESAAAALAYAEAGLKAARAGVELARLNLEYTRITSPITGKVSRPTVVAGSVVFASAPLVTVLATDTVHVTFDVDEGTALRMIRAAKAKKATTAPAQVGLLDEADLPHRGQADFSDLRFNPSTGTAQGRVTLPNPDGIFLPGLSATVHLVEGKPYKALLITLRAVLNDAQGMYVFVVTPGGVLERRHISVGRRQGALAPVKGGLKEADLVVIEPATLPGWGRGVDPALAVGTPVDPEKVAMPERATRPDSPRGLPKRGPGVDTKWGGKGKTRP